MVRRTLPLHRRIFPTHYALLFHADFTEREQRLVAEVVGKAGIQDFSISNTATLFHAGNQIILDLGAGVSSTMWFQNGVLADTVSDFFGGDDLTEEIKKYFLVRHFCQIGTRTAEMLKISDPFRQAVKGIDSRSALPVSPAVPDADLQELRDEYSRRVAQLILRLLNRNPEANRAKIMLSGGCAPVKHLPQRIEEFCHISVCTGA